jgi:hypothetical protein
MKKKLLLVFIILLLAAAAAYYLVPRYTNTYIPIKARPVSKEKKDLHFIKLKSQAANLKRYAREKRLSTEYCFLIDMSLPSGRKRFFVYDFLKDTIINSGLVAHGSCNTAFLEAAEFSNTVGAGCSSLGRYKVGYAYNGNFGKAYKLYGLDSTNSNAFERFVVLHSYECVPDYEIHPQPVCNSLGCPMVSPKFLNELEALIDRSPRPVLLWIF